jgi:transposase
MLREGKTHREVARALKASLSSVVRWQQAYRRGRDRALRPRPTPGRPPLLSPVQREELRHVLVQGAQASGYTTELWTLKRIAKLIHRRYGVRYSLVGVWKLLRHGLRWSPQKPERRARQRDDAAIERWKRVTWPHIKKRRSPSGSSRVSR